MIRKASKLSFFLCAGLLFYYCSSRIFYYTTHTTPPQINILNLKDKKNYTKQLPFTLNLESPYALYSLEIAIDGQVCNIPALQPTPSDLTAIPLTLNIENLESGQHTMSITAIDKSYHRNKAIKQLSFSVDNNPLTINLASTEFSIKQGKTLHFQFKSNKPLANAQASLLAHQYDCYPVAANSTSYECFIPIDCEQLPCDAILDVTLQDYTDNQQRYDLPVHILSAAFPKQKGLHVSDEKLEREKEASMSAKILESALSKWLKNSPKQKLWHGPFEKPVEVKWVSTPFGEIRTTPQRGRYHHLGVDLANHPKSVVWASNNGNVIIKDRFLMTGNTVVLDHGLGVFTLYCHLEDFTDIEVGDSVKKGNPIGRLGMTGYASGYHLHWELRINNISVDPFEWTTSIY